MTKIRRQGDSSMIEDRRGQGGGGSSGGLGFPLPGGGGGGSGFPFPMKMGGGMIGILVMLAVLVLPKLMKGGGLGAPASSGDTPTSIVAPNIVPEGDAGGGQDVDTGAAGAGACDTETAQIVCGAVEDVQNYWVKAFKAGGRDYRIVPTVFFSGGTDTGCGAATAQTGPFYCPVDSKVYFDLDFLTELQDRFGAQGDLASQYIVAHEYGHHVQNVLGISDQVHQAQQSNPAQANPLSVRLELQADCLAGAWARDASDRGAFDPGEIDEAINAAAAVGDDRIQRETQGRVDPESFTHGSSEQRKTWFKTGFASGSSDSCDTFSE